MRCQDLLSSLRQFQRRVAVIGSVAYLIANNPGGLLAMSRGAGDRGKVKPWNLLIRRGGGRDLGDRQRCVEVSFGEGMSGDDMGDVDDAAYQVMVEPVALGEGMSGDEVGDIDDAAYQMVVEPVTFVHPCPAAGP